MGILSVKICGLRDRGNVEEVAALLPDYIGFNFVPTSKRYVGESFDPTIRELLRSTTKAVGVFVNDTLERIENKVTTYSLEAVQLHGDEPPDFCRAIKSRFPQLEVIKTIAVAEDGSFSPKAEYDHAADKLLFDSASEARGGSGKMFNWVALEKREMQLPFFVSGGIGPNHVDAIRGALHKMPKLYGVDINSKFESAPGMKLTRLISRFLEDLSS